MLRLKKRGEYWHVNGTFTTPKGSIKVRESTGTSSKKDAEAYLNHKLEQLKNHVDGISDITFYEASLAYINEKQSIHENDAQRIGLLNDFFAKQYLSGITGSSFSDFVTNEIPKAAPSYINRYRSNLVAILNHAKHNTPLQHINKIPSRKVPTSKPRYLSFEEQEILLNAYSPLLRPLIHTLCFQGCRVGEALRLQWADLDLDKRRINIWKTKNGDFRSVPMHPRVFEILRSINRERKGHLFVTQMGEPYCYIHKPNGSPIKTAHRTALKEAGITNFKVHNWRSHWASNMALKGANTYELMALGGWKSSSSVEHYVRLNPDGLANAINRLD